MARKVSNNLDLNNNQALNMLIQNLTADPTGIESKIYYNTVSKKYRFYNGTTWADVATAGGGGDASTNTSSSVVDEIALFSDTGGKTIKRATTTGMLKGASGVLSAGTPGTDYTTPSSSEAFTNKSINANGAGNSITNLETADFAANVIDTDVTLAANSDTRLATQKAVKAYTDALLNAQNAMVFKGAIDASSNPNYPAADSGHVYKISVAGKIGGASGVDVTAGDTIYCITDGSAAGNQATVGTNWVVVQANVDSATTTTTGLVELATQAEAEAKTDAVRAVTPASLTTFTRKVTGLIGDNSSTSIAVTHNLNTKNVICSLRKVSTDDQWLADPNCNTVNQVTFAFAVAPTTDEFEVTIIG